MKDKKFYVVLIFNFKENVYDKLCSFTTRLDYCKELMESTFKYLTSSSCCKPVMKIFYTNDCFKDKFKLISIDNKESITVNKNEIQTYNL